MLAVLACSDSADREARGILVGTNIVSIPLESRSEAVRLTVALQFRLACADVFVYFILMPTTTGGNEVCLGNVDRNIS